MQTCCFCRQGVETGEQARRVTGKKMGKRRNLPQANGAQKPELHEQRLASSGMPIATNKNPVIPTKKLFTCLPLFGQETLISQSCPGKKMASYG